MRKSTQNGLTLVEILIVVAIIGILANIAIPNLVEAMYRARATRILADFKIVEDAAIRYFIDHNEFPRDRRRGRMPPELEPYLEGRVQWRHPDYEYDWENWSRRRRGRGRAGILVGFTVFSRNERLLTTLDKVYDGPYLYVRRRRRTFPIQTSR